MRVCGWFLSESHSHEHWVCVCKGILFYWGFHETFKRILYFLSLSLCKPTATKLLKPVKYVKVVAELCAGESMQQQQQRKEKKETILCIGIL